MSGQKLPFAPFHLVRRSGRKLVQRIAAEAQFRDEARFLRSWFDRPLITGAVYPSGKVLARRMASYVNPDLPGPIVELGPGTGPVTEALLAGGISEERLVLVEFNQDFCRLLRRRFPKARIIEGDAYRLSETIGPLEEPAAAIVSSLPLFTRPEVERVNLLQNAFTILGKGFPFIQFTYATSSPIPLKGKDFYGYAGPRIWRNLPPARVWVYRMREEIL